MPSQHDLTIKQPIKIWNRELSFSPRQIFTSMGKAAISVGTANYPGAAKHVLDAFNGISIKDKPEYAAYTLVYQSVLLSIAELIEEYGDFFPRNIEETQLEKLANELEASFNEIEVGFDASFFDQPHKLPLLDDLRDPLITWLTALGMAKTEADAFHLRLKSRFVLALHNQWLEKPSEYACIEKALTSPFVLTTKETRTWMRYNAWLQEQANERMFAEAFSLSQIYVPLRAYYKEKSQEPDDETNHKQEPETKKIVIDLHEEVESWVRNFDAESAIKIISGGPGSGKSSFAKMFAAFVAREMPEIPVLFIPLHHFDPTENLTSAVEQFVNDERYLSGSPLSASDGQDRLLIIFDGLDELAMQGKAAAETANHFIEEVISKIDKYNGQQLKRQVLITGRDMAIQSAENRFRGDRQILHVLPYFINENEVKAFVDAKNRLAEDQRDQWWKNYSELKCTAYNGIPNALKIDRLTPITREPLLNYLVALSYERKKIAFTEKTTLNVIYQDLLQAVHERQWDHGKHSGAKHLKCSEFTRILEDIALALWHGDGRVATVSQIYERCNSNDLDRYLEAVEEGGRGGISRLLTAFYFRQSEKKKNRTGAFEFTHKSFGEYLITKRIVRAVKQIHSELMRNKEDPNTGTNETEALRNWVEICGPTTIDHYVFEFLRNEIATYPQELADWQKTFANLIGLSIRNGTPMEKSGIEKFKEMMRQSRNAEELLMVIHHSCSVKTRKLSEINWGENNTAIGEWINRLQGQRSLPATAPIVLKCLSYLNLTGALFDAHDFIEANLKGSDLSHCQLIYSNFFRADLENTKFYKTILHKANFSLANLSNTNFEHANLTRSCFLHSRLESLNFKGATLRFANLQSVTIGHANFENANLEGADIRKSNLNNTNFKGANLRKTNFQGAMREKKAYTISNEIKKTIIFPSADLKGANLEDSNFEDANLGDANLQGANLQGANLEGANLEGANLEGANLKDTNTEGANFKYANLKGTILEGIYSIDLTTKTEETEF